MRHGDPSIPLRKSIHAPEGRSVPWATYDLDRLQITHPEGLLGRFRSD